MKWLTFKIQKSHGFRLNLIDIIFISLVMLASYFIYLNTPGLTLYLIPLYLVFSFFLFCNVFRIGTRLETYWYIPFVIIAMTSIYQLNLELFWLGALIILEPVKWLLIFYKIKVGPYKGIFSKKQ